MCIEMKTTLVFSVGVGKAESKALSQMGTHSLLFKFSANRKRPTTNPKLNVTVVMSSGGYIR